MAPQKFYLLGKEPSTGKYVDVSPSLDLTSLRDLVAAAFAVVEPSGVFPAGMPDTVDYGGY